jgi:hypothetical protein
MILHQKANRNCNSLLQNNKPNFNARKIKSKILSKSKVYRRLRGLTLAKNNSLTSKQELELLEA